MAGGEFTRAGGAAGRRAGRAEQRAGRQSSVVGRCRRRPRWTSTVSVDGGAKSHPLAAQHGQGWASKPVLERAPGRYPCLERALTCPERP